jgi:hypothetical protein
MRSWAGLLQSSPGSRISHRRRRRRLLQTEVILERNVMEANTIDKKREAFQAGVVVLILLAALTIGEYFIGAIAVGWLAPLWGIAILKAVFIMRDYMHVGRLFGEDEEGHS